MKLRSFLFVGFAVCIALLPSCDGTESTETESAEITASTMGSTAALGTGATERSKLSTTGLAAVRARADAAFAEMKGASRSRFESRIGLQPWPEDLPSNWPTPSRARVVAVTMQPQGNRLLLVDLPGSPRAALESYRDLLRAGGYHVVRPARRESTHALHAILDDDEAVLTFFERRQATRLEILFVGRSSG
jgi:hypothetical protein